MARVLFSKLKKLICYIRHIYQVLEFYDWFMQDHILSEFMMFPKAHCHATHTTMVTTVALSRRSNKQ